MVSQEIKVTNPTGLHMRPAAYFVKGITPFKSEVRIHYDDKVINGKSLMVMMSAAIKSGSDIVVECEGEDEAEALAKAIEMIESGLGE